MIRRIAVFVGTVQLSSRPECPTTGDPVKCHEWCNKEGVRPEGMDLLYGVRGGSACTDNQDESEFPNCICYDENHEKVLAECKIQCAPLKRAEVSSERANETEEKYKGPLTDEVTTRYWFYDTKLGEGFNLQREVFTRAAWVVYKMNQNLDERCPGKNTGTCARWTLVLPPWCWVAHWRKVTDEEDLLPWSHFFSTKGFEEAPIPIIEYNEYEKLHGNEVDLVITYTTLDGMGTAGFAGEYKEFAGWTETISECTSRYREVPEYKKEADGTFNVVYSGRCPGGVRTKNFRCGILKSPFPETVIDMMDNVVARNQRSVLIKNYDYLVSPDALTLDKLKLREAMFYKDQLRKIGDDLITEKFKDQPYLSCHLRRTDFLRARKDTTPINFKGPVDRIKEVMEERGLKHVFIATDASKEEKEEIRELLPHAVFFEQKLEHVNFNPIVESWIAIRGEYFIGTIESRFTMSIQLERSFYGHSIDTSSEEFCGPKREGKNKDSKMCTAPNYRHSTQSKGVREGYCSSKFGKGGQGEEGKVHVGQGKDEL